MCNELIEKLKLKWKLKGILLGCDNCVYGRKDNAHSPRSCSIGAKYILVKNLDDDCKTYMIKEWKDSTVLVRDFPFLDMYGGVCNNYE